MWAMKKKKTLEKLLGTRANIFGVEGKQEETYPHLPLTRLADLFEIRTTFNCFNLIIKPFLNLMDAVFMCFQIWP